MLGSVRYCKRAELNESSKRASVKLTEFRALCPALAMTGRGGRPAGVEEFEGAAAVHGGGPESSLATVHSAGAQVRRC